MFNQAVNVQCARIGPLQCAAHRTVGLVPFAAVATQLRIGEQTVKPGRQIVEIARLAQVIVGPVEPSQVLISLTAPTGQDHYGYLVKLTVMADDPQRVDPVKFGHIAIEDHHIGRAKPDRLDHLFAVVNPPDHEPAIEQRMNRQVGKQIVIIGQQYARHGQAPGVKLG